MGLERLFGDGDRIRRDGVLNLGLNWKNEEGQDLGLQAM